MLLLLIPLVFGIECQRVTLTGNVPCTIISSYKPITGCDSNISYYDTSGLNVLNSTWSNSVPFCNTTFSISTAGTYIYNSSIENGVIVVEQVDNMLSIILTQLFLIAFFVIIGLPHKVGFVKIFSWSLAIVELLLTVWFIYIVESGGDINSLLYVNAIGILIVGGTLGFITLFAVMYKLMHPDDEKKIADDSYTKWITK